METIKNAGNYVADKVQSMFFTVFAITTFF